MIWTKSELWELKEMYEDPFNSTRDIANHFNISIEKLYAIARKKGFGRGKYYEYGYQKCSACKEILEVNPNNFYVNKNNKSGFGYECKSCVKKRKAALYKRQKEKQGMNKSTLGIVRKLDKLCRITVPKEYVRELQLQPNSKMEIIFEDGVIKLKPYKEEME